MLPRATRSFWIASMRCPQTKPQSTCRSGGMFKSRQADKLASYLSDDLPEDGCGARFEPVDDRFRRKRPATACGRSATPKQCTSCAPAADLRRYANRGRSATPPRRAVSRPRRAAPSAASTARRSPRHRGRCAFVQALAAGAGIVRRALHAARARDVVEHLRDERRGVARPGGSMEADWSSDARRVGSRPL